MKSLLNLARTRSSEQDPHTRDSIPFKTFGEHESSPEPDHSHEKSAALSKPPVFQQCSARIDRSVHWVVPF